MINIKNQLFCVLLITIFFIPIIPVTSQKSPTPLPTIDGKWSPNEWPSSIISNYYFKGRKEVQFAYRVNETHIFMTARYMDTDPSFYGSTCSDPYGLFDKCSDAFAVGFDLNGDQSYMGSSTSPDDGIFVGMMGNSSIDVYMTGVRKDSIIFDTEVGGTNDSFGKLSYNYNDQYFTFEMVKKLDSGDTIGHDIQLQSGSSINLMLAYWNNLPPRQEISGYTPWIKLVIVDPTLTNIDIATYILPLTIALVVFIGIIVIKFKLNFY